MHRYRFGEFVLSPRRRTLLREGHEQPLIPRYFDLLVFLVEHRHAAVHRREIFDRVWSDVIVSDSALSQAIRTIRRTLGDDSREPRFIRTVSRHGYQFVFPEVREEPDEGAVPAWEDAGSAPDRTAAPPGIGAALDSPGALDAVSEGALVPDAVPEAAGAPDERERDPFEPLMVRVARRARTSDELEDQRDAAERLHALGTQEALRRVGERPGHEYARAVLRDTRWDVPGAGPVPLLGHPGALEAATALTLLRLRRAGRAAARRWAGGATGGGIAGLIAGGAGGLILSVTPGSAAPAAVAVVLAVVGGICGAIGGAGVGAGLSCADAVARSRRALAVLAGGACGGGAAGAATQWVSRWSLAALVGVQVPVGGAFEGFVLGAALGIAYALGTPRHPDGLPAPRGRARARLALGMAAAAGAAALALTAAGRPLVGGTIHTIAEASGAHAMLTPLGDLIGDPGFGRVTQMLIGTAEGLLFGAGFALGLTRRR